MATDFDTEPGVDGTLGYQRRLAKQAGVSPVGRSGADLDRDLRLVQAELPDTSGEGAARLDQIVNQTVVNAEEPDPDPDPDA